MVTLNCNGRLLVIDQPLVMGIINVTPDSFYGGSRFSGTDAVLAQCDKMISEGADIGSQPVSAEEELKRVIGNIAAIHKKFPEVFISADTYHARVAKEAAGAGASIINDISAGSMDRDLITTVAALKVPYVLMHMKGIPQTMQQLADYEDVVKEVLDFFIENTARLRNAGITDIIADPGFGFGKSIAQNFQLLKNLAVFKMLSCPLLVGVSRKSTIYKTLNITADEALNGTTVLNTIGLLNGASIIRVHDVKEAKEAVKLVAACMKET